jgi:hypothetical protein
LTGETFYGDVSLRVTAWFLVLAEGFYLLRALTGEADTPGVSGIHLSAPPLTSGLPNEVMLDGLVANGGYLSPSGDVGVAKAGPSGGVLLVNAYGSSDKVAHRLPITVERLNRSSAPLPSDFNPTRDVATEVTVSINRLGLRRFAGGGWAGSRSRRLPIHSLAVNPIDPLRAAMVEVKAFGASARESDWVSGGRLCGPFDGNQPLMGFAARISPAVDCQLAVIYHGWFVSAGMIGPRRDGEPCLSPMLGDPLGAITVQIYERPSY